MKLALLGTGYVGLTSGAGFAEFGHEVVCADIDAAKIDALRSGRIPFHEPDLLELVARGVAQERLRFTTSTTEALRGADVVFLAVGTPQGEDGCADLRAVLAAAEAAGRALDRDGVILVTKSTVPVGTTERVAEVVRVVTTRRFSVATNPEFLREGEAVADFLQPDRVVLGVEDPAAAEVLRRLYAPFVRDPGQLLVMGIRSAELTKYASNAMLATRISFMNEMAALCEATGADVEDVRRGVGADRRIGPAFLRAGCSFGGSCFTKDLQALVAMTRAADAAPRIAEAALATNRHQRGRFVSAILRSFGGTGRGRVVGLWGLSFKPHTDDLRDAPALDIVQGLLRAGAAVQVHDPAALAGARRLLGDAPGLLYCDEAEAAATGADALVLVTEWPAYLRPDWGQLRGLMKGRAVFDGRNAWDREAVREAGLRYQGVGRDAGPWHRDKQGEPCYASGRVPWEKRLGWERCTACDQAMPQGFSAR